MPTIVQCWHFNIYEQKKISCWTELSGQKEMTEFLPIKVCTFAVIQMYSQTCLKISPCLKVSPKGTTNIDWIRQVHYLVQGTPKRCPLNRDDHILKHISRFDCILDYEKSVQCKAKTMVLSWDVQADSGFYSFHILIYHIIYPFSLNLAISTSLQYFFYMTIFLIKIF